MKVYRQFPRRYHRIMPKKSAKAKCTTSGSKATTAAASKTTPATSSTTRGTKRVRSVSVPRSPILTRSRTRAGASMSSPMDNSDSSRTPPDERAKRKYSVNSDPKVADPPKESTAKKAKASKKSSKNNNNTMTSRQNEMNNLLEANKQEAKDRSDNRNQNRDSSFQAESVIRNNAGAHNMNVSSSGASSGSHLVGVVNNLNMEYAFVKPLENCPMLPTATSMPPFVDLCAEGEMPNDGRKDRKLITTSDFQRSLLSAMQRTKNSPSGSSAENAPGVSGASDMHNVLRIKIKEEPCKFSKTEDASSVDPAFLRPACSSGAQGSVQDGELPSVEELSNPFFSRRIFIPENAGANAIAEPGVNTAASVGNDEGDLGRLQALMDSRRIPLSLFGVLESRMQQLFHKNLSCSSSSNRAQQLLQELQNSDDDEHQLQVLIEITQLLVMGNEDTLVGFPVKQIVPVLINLLLKEYNFELMNQACRALTYLIEALPRSSSVVVEAIPILLNKVQVIQCIDVAEQALTALKMLSKWHSKSILQSKGISACLMHLDFFSINAQRTALAVISNCCQNILPHEFNLVEDSLSVLTGWLTNQDEKSVESICLAFSGLVECFKNDHNSLMQIGTRDFLTNIQQLLVVSPPIISSQVFTTVVHMLGLLCTACSEIVVILLKQNFAETLHYLLINSASATKEIELSPRSPQEFLEISSLICEMMPFLPSDDLFKINSMIVEAKRKGSSSNAVIWQWKDDAGYWHSHDRNDSRNMEEAYQRGNVKLYISDRTALNVDLQTMEQYDDATGSPRQLRRHIISSESHRKMRGEFFNDNKELVISAIRVLFPVLYEMYCSTAGTTVKSRCIRAILRMVYYAPPDVLQEVLKHQCIARHISAMLASQNLRSVISALQMAEVLIQKLPSEFKVHFIREGVLHEIKELSCIDVNTWLIEKAPEFVNCLPPSNEYTSSSSSSRDCMGGESVISVCDPSQSSGQASFPVFSNVPQPSSSSAKDETPPKELNVATKIRDVLKRRYMNIKRTFGASDREHNSTCISDTVITNESKIKVNVWIKTQAQAFHDKYFHADQMSSHPVISVLNNLSEAVKGLESVKDNGLKSLIGIREVVTQNDISSFELIHSGLMKKLELYLSASRDDSLPFGFKNHEDRLRTFLHVFVGSPLTVNPEVDVSSFNTSALVNLVVKLNACVSHLEQFPVKVYDQAACDSNMRSGVSIMKFFNMHQLKCLFQRHPSCTTLRQWHSGPVMIDPLASIHNVDRYLTNQGYGTIKSGDDSDSDISYDESSDEDSEMVVADIRMDHGQASPKLQFLIGKNVLPYNMTLYQAVRQYCPGENQTAGQESELPAGIAALWMKTHTIWYRPIPPQEDAQGSSCSESSKNCSNASNSNSAKKKVSSSRPCNLSRSNSDKSKSSKSKKDILWETGVVPEISYPSSLIGKVNGLESVKDPSLGVIILLKVIHGLNYHWGLLYQKNAWSPLLDKSAFINNELTLKVNRQLQDPLAIMTGNTPSWLGHLAYNFPFLFPFETRHLLFYITSFDRERALQRLLDTIPDLTNSDKFTPRLEKRKKMVSRNNLLKQAESILQDHADSRALLEVQYKNEVGTGLGPTLEFYSLVSKELQRADLDMWRMEESSGTAEKNQGLNYVYSQSGLFPMPLSRNTKTSSMTKICNKFKLLGKFLAKAIMDSRLIDIPLSLAFYRWMLSQEKYLSLADLQHVDNNLAHTISKMEKLVIAKKKMEEDISLSGTVLMQALEDISLEGCLVSDLCLDFTLPGYSRIEMKRGGKDTQVSIHNLDEYLKLLKYWSMYEGVSKQMRAFKEGFESVFSLSRLQVFYPDELPILCCGNNYDTWDEKSLAESCKPDHGYSLDSQAIKYLFEIMCNFTPDQQRQFVQFITGSPRLPIGGLKALSPPLTIVRKTTEDEEDDKDNYLPSVMTCVNYLKLPDYTSMEIMKKKLQIAISEGQQCFHLS